jgi:hypothetical protein
MASGCTLYTASMADWYSDVREGRPKRASQTSHQQQQRQQQQGQQMIKKWQQQWRSTSQQLEQPWGFSVLTFWIAQVSDAIAQLEGLQAESPSCAFHTHLHAEHLTDSLCSHIFLLSGSLTRSYITTPDISGSCGRTAAQQYSSRTVHEYGSTHQVISTSVSEYSSAAVQQCSLYSSSAVQQCSLLWALPDTTSSTKLPYGTMHTHIGATRHAVQLRGHSPC